VVIVEGEAFRQRLQEAGEKDVRVQTAGKPETGALGHFQGFQFGDGMFAPGDDAGDVPQADAFAFHAGLVAETDGDLGRSRGFAERARGGQASAATGLQAEKP
jgi:hypothetical protein